MASLLAAPSPDLSLVLRPAYRLKSGYIRCMTALFQCVSLNLPQVDEHLLSPAAQSALVKALSCLEPQPLVTAEPDV